MAATGESCIKDGRQSLAVISSDLMLLAVSVIGAASYIVNQTTSDMVMDVLCCSGYHNTCSNLFLPSSLL